MSMVGMEKMSREELWGDQFLSEMMEMTSALCQIGPDWNPSEEGFQVIQTAYNEVHFHKEGYMVDIVKRTFFDNKVFYHAEPLVFMGCNDDKAEITFTSDYQFNSFLQSQYHIFRQYTNTECGMLTRLMPRIIISILKMQYGMEDRELLLEYARWLVSFGTADFGKDSAFEYAKDEVYLDFRFKRANPLMSTLTYISYAPGEIEAIAKVSYEMLKDKHYPGQIRSMNMYQFRKRLRKETAEIKPTSDVFMYGRYLFGSGLKEYWPVLRCAKPISVTSPASIG